MVLENIGAIEAIETIEAIEAIEAVKAIKLSSYLTLSDWPFLMKSVFKPLRRLILATVVPLRLAMAESVSPLRTVA